jgi:outer membrane lipoprotein SlyB
MRKYIISFVIMTLVAGLFIFAAPANTEALAVQAQERSYYVRRVVRNGRVRYVRVRKPSYYRRHRNRINVAAGTGAGALIGGLAGGGKGALIGAGIGAGSSALYTYKLNKKKRRYKKIRRY